MNGSAEVLVEVRDVFVSYRGAAAPVMALRGADLTVAAGERLVVQGPNGSGKTTLLQVITGEQPVATGTVRVAGVLLHELSAAARRHWRARNVGFLDQHARRNLLGELDVVDNVALQLRLTGARAAAARQQAHRLLDELGVSELTGRPVTELSGGEAQRVAICAALAHRPRLVLADEPTGELDESAAADVHQLLSGVAAAGAAVVLVSHDARSLEFADRAVRVRDGRVAEQWRPGSADVEQLPDSRGWIRVPPELWSVGSSGAGLVASRLADGLLLRPRAGVVSASPGPEAPLPGRGAAPAPRGSEPTSSAGRRPAPVVPLVRLAGVAAAYPGHPLFDGLAARLDPGEWLAVTGASGSGKSTLLSIVAGLLDRAAGAVEVTGVDWSGLDRGQRAELRRRTLALAPQRPWFTETLTVRENLELTIAVRGGTGDGADPTTAADRLGLAALLDQPVRQLSGGERQRVAVARCLVAGVPLLVLDEPTSEQDDASAERVVSVLAEETRAGRAVLAASHDPRLLERAGRLLRLGPGASAQR